MPSISLGAAIKDATRAKKAMLELPEVTRVVSRSGRPELATVVIGGLITSTPFTLYVLPLIYRWLVPDNGNGDEKLAVPATIEFDT